MFTLPTPQELLIDTTAVGAGYYIATLRISETELYAYQKYDVSYDIDCEEGFGGASGLATGYIGLYNSNYDPVSFYDWGVYTYPGTCANNGATGLAQPTTGGTFAISTSFYFRPPECTGDNAYNINTSAWYKNKLTKYSIGFQAWGGYSCSITNMNIKADVYQPGYWSQTEFFPNLYQKQQALIPWNKNCLSGSFDIWNTQSIIFENSDYNPLNNNVEINRRSTHHYELQYASGSGYIPSNAQDIIGVMYNTISSSAKADLQDSNYTSLAALNPTYRGSKIKSLNYNFYTSGGYVGPVNSLRQQPYNQFPTSQASKSVALQFADGSTGSWGGDDVNGKLTSVIDHYPQYIAHFRNSSAYVGYYNSREFRIDSLISISMENLSGEEITPISVDLDGSNQKKKWVSSIFSPDRKVAVSYTPQKVLNTRKDTGEILNIEPVRVGNYDLLGGSIQFLTINSNAKNISQNANKYNYTKGRKSLGQIIPFTGKLTGSITAVTSTSNGYGIISASNEIDKDSDSAGTATGGFMTNFQDGNPNIKVFPGDWGAFAVTKINDEEVLEVTFYDYYPHASFTPYTSSGYIAGQLLYVGTGSMIAYSTGTPTIPLIIQIPQENILDGNTIGVGQLETTVQMVTSSNTNADGTHFGFLLSGSLTTGSTPPSTGTASADYELNASYFYVPFSQDEFDETGRVIGTALPDSAKLSIGGPQLALFHAYNSLIASQSIQPATALCNAYSHSDAWILDGQNPANPNNYYQWKPSASDCPYYEDDGEAFLIQRGDILRVEGIKSFHSPFTTNLTSSISFVEDFTVMEMQNYYYTASSYFIDDGTLTPSAYPLGTRSGPNSMSPYNNQFSGYPGYMLGLVTEYLGVPIPWISGFSVTQSDLATGVVGGDNHKGFNAVGAAGRLNTTADALLSSITVQPTSATDATYTGVPIGSFIATYPATFTITVSGGNITAIQAEGNGGGGYYNGLTLTIDAGELGATSTMAKIVLTPNDLKHGKGGELWVTPDFLWITGAGYTWRISAEYWPPNQTTDILVRNGGGDPAVDDAYDYEDGDTLNISAAWLTQSGMFDNSTYFPVAQDIQVTINSSQIIGGVPPNNFTAFTDFNAGCTPSESFNAAGYKSYEIGELGFTLNTFVKTDRNPSLVLDGLDSGAITKFTLRRQVENEKNVMIKNTQAPRGSKGKLTQTGGGFLIPKDLSETQNQNALNIINQLRQKNAFPGDTAPDNETEYS